LNSSKITNNILIFTIFSLLFISCKKADDNSKNNIQPGSNTTIDTGKTRDKKVSVKDDIIIKTSDSKELSASYYYKPDLEDAPSPLVILIHQFSQTKEQWYSNFIDSIVISGIKVLTYDIRGHGKSTKVNYELSKLLEDPTEAPNDIIAVFEWAKNKKGIEPARIGVMGTSIGGNLACYAAYNLNAKAIVSVSNSKSTFEKYIGFSESLTGSTSHPKFKSALLICGSKDGNHEQDQRWILENYIDSPKEIKVYDSAKHGKFLIEQFPEINSISINWFKKYL